MVKSWQSWMFRVAALFAMSLAVYRATTQAITLDEAMTYLWYVKGLELNHLWTPFPNNHVLNSILIWVSTHIFGTSELAVRLPALLGAGLYIVTCAFLCRRITNSFSLQFPLFLCLILNPFILDFMVAARGYSLANAFLLSAIAIPVWHRNGGPSLRTSCALASLALGLSFTANFSFAIVDAVVFAVILIWALRERKDDSLPRILALCALPGALAVLLIAGYPLAHWPSNELIYGAHSFREMVDSIVEPTLHQLDPQYRLERWYRRIMRYQPYLLPALGTLCLLQLAISYRKMTRIAAALLSIVAGTLLIHWTAFRMFDLLLPRTRTAIFFIPLLTLTAGAVAAASVHTRVFRVLRAATTTMLATLAVYFLLCLRVSYFEEYYWDADLKDIYATLAELNRTGGVKTVEANGLYHASLDFYRHLSGTETFTEFTVMGDQPTAGKDAYVVLSPNRQPSVHGLRVIYQGKSTDATIAVR